MQQKLNRLNVRIASRLQAMADRGQPPPQLVHTKELLQLTEFEEQAISKKKQPKPRHTNSQQRRSLYILRESPSLPSNSTAAPRRATPAMVLARSKWALCSTYSARHSAKASKTASASERTVLSSRTASSSSTRLDRNDPVSMSLQLQCPLPLGLVIKR